jgi:hypothetical protein
MVRRHDRVAQRDVDALPSDRRHRMRGVAEEEEPGARPSHEPIADDVEQERMRDPPPLGPEVRGEIGRHVRRHLVDPALDPAAADVAVRPLVDDPGELEPAVVRGKGEGEVA